MVPYILQKVLGILIDSFMISIISNWHYDAYIGTVLEGGQWIIFINDEMDIQNHSNNGSLSQIFIINILKFLVYNIEL